MNRNQPSALLALAERWEAQEEARRLFRWAFSH
jgi:hypothetical protein